MCIGQRACVVADCLIVFLFCVDNRYKEYLVAKEQKIEMLKSIDDKLNECERFNKAHEVVCSIRTVCVCYLSLNTQQIQPVPMT